ncbi:MAG TPA: amine dehydrogenase large subunit [Sphingobium sp.]
MKRWKAVGTRVLGALIVTAGLGMPGNAQVGTATPTVTPGEASIPEAEENDVATLPPIGPHWAFITNWLRGGIRIVDGDSGKMLGMIHSAPFSDFAIDPAGAFFYVAETMWSRGNRGTRQDLLTIYDAHSLKIVSEIPLTGRLLIGNRPLNLSISPDGKYGFVYNLDPSTTIQVVNLVKRRLASSVEVPGCGLAIAGTGVSTASLCSDGSMATIAYNSKSSGTPSRSPVFFSAEADPIFDNSFADRRSGKAIFLTYSGLIREVSISATPVIGEPWSIQQAAGMPIVTTDALLVNWLPGGREPIAFNRKTGKAYILMHMGEYWSQKASGTELWEVDVAARKILRRKRLAKPIAAVAVTQDTNPVLMLVDEDDRLLVLDGETFEQKHEVANAGNGIIHVAGN